MEKYKNSSLVLEANAGSGKTFNLVSRYLSHLFMGVAPEKIVALTFGKKTRKEMYDRIISSLNNPDESNEIIELSKEMNISKDEIAKRSKDSLNRLINSDIKILTIDSFIHSILKKFSHYLDIVPNFKVVTNIDEKKFKTNFLKKLDKSIYKQNILTLELVDKNLDVDNIIAVLTDFYLKEIEICKIKDSYINLKVENTLLDREKEILNIADLISDWLLDDSHKLSNSAKKALQFSNLEELLVVGKTWLNKKSLSEYKTFKKAFKNSSSETVDRSFETLKELINIYLELKKDIVFHNLFKVFEFYIRERELFIKREAKFSFNDINHFLVKLILDKKIDSKFIYFILDNSIEHLMLDEFQDTNLFQYKILKPLIDDILSGGSDISKTFFYVGDKMQSLYRFRGAFSSLFDYVADNSSIEKQTLQKNYRSKKNIVDFINYLFDTKQEIGDKKQVGGNITLKEFENPIEHIFDEVQILINLNIKLENIAIICAKNSEIDQITDILSKHNIDMQVDTNQTLNEHLPVKAVIQYILYLYYIKESGNKFYLKNFQAIIGQDIKDDFENSLNIDLDKFSLYQVGLKIIQYFQLFDGDENTLKFLESLQTTYFDIDDFVYNYHLEISKIEKTKKSGINILTIHKSKGLEFPHVIFLDFTLKQNGKEKFLISYNKIDVDNIVWLSKNENIFNRNYLKLMESENQFRDEDVVNRLYVGLTRAEKSLTILKKEKNSSFDYLNNSASKIDVSKYSDNIEVEKDSNSDFDKVDLQSKFQFEDKFYGYQNDQTITNVDELKSAKFDIDYHLKYYEKQEFGIALHSTIEVMNDFTKENLYIAIENSRNRFFNLTKLQFLDIEKRIISMIKDKNFQNLISNGKISKEQNYIFKDKSFYIDMLIEKTDEVIVCDFKSSENIEFLEKYDKQVREYIEIVQSLDLKNRKIRGYLIYLYPDKLKLEEIN